jgi:hypothetical protein
MSGSNRRRFFIVKAQEQKKEFEELIKKMDADKVNGKGTAVKKTRK